MRTIGELQAILSAYRAIGDAQTQTPLLGEECFMAPKRGSKKTKAPKRGNIPSWIEKRPYGGYIARDERIAELRARLAEREATETPLVGEDDDDGFFVSPDSGDRESLRRGQFSRAPLSLFGGSRDLGDGV